MNINIGAVIAILIVLFCVGAAVMMGNADVSSPALAAQEIQQGTPGAATSTIIFNQVASILLGILVTGAVGGVGGAVLMATRDWMQDLQKPDWVSGPNANFQRRGQQKTQGMSRDDLFQLALLNMMSQNQQRNIPQITTTRTDTEEYSEF